MNRLAGLAFAVALPATSWGADRILDDFDAPREWSVEASEGVKAALRAAPGPHGHALCLDYDFDSVSGYAIARRPLALELTGNFELVLGVSGEGPPNALQVKLVDASGENVWWNARPDFSFPREWQPLRIRKREIAFAWGPARDHALARTASLELAVARGEGGRGSACFDRLALRERPEPPARFDRPVASATSTAAGSDAALAVDASVETAWRSDPAAGAAQALTLDLGAPREFGGIVLRWLPDLHASRFEIDVSNDAMQWQVARRVAAARGGFNALLMPESEARYVRIRMLDGPAKAYGLAQVEIRDLAFGASPNAFFEALAREAPRGRYPRAFTGEQSYWTVVGIDGGTAQGLLSEDGALEPRAGEAAVEPMLLVDGKLLTWADVAIEHTLADDCLPIPTVTWRAPGLALRITAFGAGTRSSSQVIARYTLENRAPRAREVTLVLALRPFQVNPPGQFLNSPGGVARVRTIAWNGSALAVDGEPRMHFLEQPSEAFGVAFDAGSLAEVLAGDRRGFGPAVEDPSGFASAVLLFRLLLPAGGSRSVAAVAPLSGGPQLPAREPLQWVQAQEEGVASRWREKLGGVKLRVPAAGKPIADTIRTALAHMLIDRNGPALQPGTRAYARSWIRDGAMMSEALLRAGHAPEVREFADWFAPHLFASGKVPCCVDRRGADPVPENDSHGEWAHLVGEYFRYTHDAAWARTMWPGVSRALRYMDGLRATSDGAAGRELRGLMPPSISHEGYSDKPAWSYWDDFWALAGYRSAAELAGAIGRRDEARAIATRRDAFQRDLRESIGASRARHGIEYIPGSADRGDFDATSTTIALAPAAQLGALPRAWFDATFERYWREFAARRDGRAEWDAYTPYELRNVGAFVRLGWRERSQALLDFFMADRRPAGWNQWAEVVGRDARKPRFVGDMPHGWVASDFIRSALDLFAYERTSDRSIVLAAGIPLAWLEGDGVAIEGMRTPWGELSYSLRRDAKGWLLEVPARTALPPGGLVLPWRCEIRVKRVPARRVIDERCAP